MRLAMISPYPDKERKLLTKMSAVAQYMEMLNKNKTKHAKQECDTTIFTEYFSQPETYFEESEDSRVFINRCYQKGKHPFWSILKQLWKSDAFDIIHIEHEIFLYGGITSLPSLIFFMLMVRMRSNCIITLHHVISKQQINRTFNEIYNVRIHPVFIRMGFWLFYKAVGAVATHIIVHEEYGRRVLTGEYRVREEKISVIPHGATILRSQNPLSRQLLLQEFDLPQDAGTVFGFFGYISKYKGLEFLFEEFNEYLKEHPKSVLLIAGSIHPDYLTNPELCAYIEKLKAMVRESNGRIVWFGTVTDEQINHFYDLIDCMILPYRQTNGGSYVLSITIGTETPFLVSEALRPLIQNDAFTFNFYKNSLKKRMEAFSNRNLHTESHAQMFVQELKRKRVWPVVAEKTSQLYESLMDARKAKPILVAGAYGQANLGDEYLLDVCLRLLGKEDCVVLSTNDKQTAHAHGVRSVPSGKFSIRTLRAFLESSVVVVGGGDQFKLIKKASGRSRYGLLAEMCLLTIANLIWRKKTLLLGIGIGDIHTRLAKAMTAFCLRYAHAVTVRDETSFKDATALSGRSDIKPASDLSFLDTAASRLPTTRFRTLAIAPAYQVEHQDQYARFIKEIGFAAQKCLSENKDLTLTFLPFQTAFHPHNDIVVSHEIMQHISATERCSVHHKLSTNTAFLTLRNTDVIWGMRLHSLVFACINSTPFIALIYDEKIRRFLREIGCEQWGIEMDETFSAEKLNALHAKLMQSLPSVIEHLNEQKKRLREKAMEHIGIVEAMKSAVRTEDGTPLPLTPFIPNP